MVSGSLSRPWATSVVKRLTYNTISISFSSYSIGSNWSCRLDQLDMCFSEKSKAFDDQLPSQVVGYGQQQGTASEPRGYSTGNHAAYDQQKREKDKKKRGRRNAALVSAV